LLPEPGHDMHRKYNALGNISIEQNYVSNDMAVSPISTFACLAPGQETRTSLSALVDFSGATTSAAQIRSISDIPSSTLANSIRLKGPVPPKAPCRGGPPTLKNPLRLLPTFQTVTAPSSRETVSSRRPSGEKVTEDTGARWGSRTYSRDAVFSSYLLISSASQF
jgi:hypothetical protein